MNKRLAILLIVILLSVVACSSAYDNHKKVVKYSLANNLQEPQDLFPVRINHRYGYINKEGKLVVAPKFKQAEQFIGNLAYISTDDGTGFINKKGEVFISNYDITPYLYNSTEDLIPIIGYNFSPLHFKTYGFMDANGKVVIEPQFEYVHNFSEGLAAVSLNNKWGFINREGKIVIKPQFNWVKDFSEGLAAVNIENKWCYIDKTGQEVIPLIDSWNIGDFKDGLAIIYISHSDKPPACGYIDKTGKQIIEPKFSQCTDFSEGLAAVKLNESKFYSYIDKTGQEAIKIEFTTHASSFSDGLAKVETSDKTGYIDKTGKFVIEGISWGQNFKNGLAQFSNSEGEGYINKEGKIVWSSTWQPKASGILLGER